MNGVQAQQFAALQKATATYQNDAKMADHLRRREVDLMNRVTEQQRRLEEELRAAHGEVGEAARNQKNIDVEGKRYKQAIEADQRSIVKITSELKGIEANEKEQKTAFVNEMESLNNENDIILTNRQNKKICQLLDAENVTWLCDTKLVARTTTTTGEVDGADEPRAAEESERWREVAARVNEELTGLVDVEEKGGAAAKESAELEQFIQQLRSKFLSENGNIGQMEIDDLEAKWEQQYEYNSFEEEGGENAMEADDGGKTAGSSPVHMELFYNNQDPANNLGYAC